VNTPEKMKALVLHGLGDIRLEERVVPRPGSGEALVKVAAAGVCGSDIPRVFTTGAHRHPIIPGHEFSGSVVEVGHGVDAAILGLRAAVAPLIPCRKCRYCEVGRFALCDDYDYLGSRRDGGFAEYCAAPAQNLVPIPAGVSMEAAAMVEPSGVALHGLRLIRVEPGDFVAIFGAGPVGCMIAQFAASMGADRIAVIDVEDGRLSSAAGMAKCETINPRRSDPIAALRGMTDGQGVDVAVEAAGVPATLVASIECVRKLGRVLLLGNPASDATLPKATISRILRGEIEIRGTWNADFNRIPHHDWATVLDAFVRGAVNPDPAITHRVGIENGVSALLMMRDRTEFHQKVMICFS